MPELEVPGLNPFQEERRCPRHQGAGEPEGVMLASADRPDNLTPPHPTPTESDARSRLSVSSVAGSSGIPVPEGEGYHQDPVPKPLLPSSVWTRHRAVTQGQGQGLRWHKLHRESEAVQGSMGKTGRSRAVEGERPMATTTRGAKRCKDRTRVSGKRPIGAPRFRQQSTQTSCPPCPFPCPTTPVFEQYMRSASDSQWQGLIYTYGPAGPWTAALTVVTTPLSPPASFGLEPGCSRHSSPSPADLRVLGAVPESKWVRILVHRANEDRVRLTEEVTTRTKRVPAPRSTHHQVGAGHCLVWRTPPPPPGGGWGGGRGKKKFVYQKKASNFRPLE